MLLIFIWLQWDGGRVWDDWPDICVFFGRMDGDGASPLLTWRRGVVAISAA
jgi:hypothetical protein